MGARRVGVLIGTAVLLGTAVVPSASAGPADGQSRAQELAAYWSADRVAQAQPRDLVIDERGFAYQRRSDGSLRPHGHGQPAARPALTQESGTSSPSPRGKPNGGDTTPPTITDLSPSGGVVVGASVTFQATITDASGIKAVTFVVTYPDGTTTQSFTPSPSGDVWSTTISGFTNGGWAWHVVAKDNGSRGGNTATSPPASFTVDTGGTPPPPPPPPGGDVASARWTAGGAVQTAAGRVYFEMPTNKKGNRWAGYVCSGTVATDSAADGRSVVITAAHCVYDDVAKVFARNVLFIPNQDGTSGSGTDTNCSNDPLGCWAPDHGVVDVHWTTRTFPNNVAWDYAYYVVGDDAHAGSGAGGPLDAAAGSLAVQFSPPSVGSVTHALGYSYSNDPFFMYCKEAMTTEGSVNWWLPNCALTGGSSGGPWVQPMDEASGTGPIISVNSWGYTNSPGMAGPKLAGTSASCVFGVATATPIGGFPDRGEVVSGC